LLTAEYARLKEVQAHVGRIYIWWVLLSGKDVAQHKVLEAVVEARAKVTDASNAGTQS
jgi:hypothetical protein